MSSSSFSSSSSRPAATGTPAPSTSIPSIPPVPSYPPPADPFDPLYSSTPPTADFIGAASSSYSYPYSSPSPRTVTSTSISHSHSTRLGSRDLGSAGGTALPRLRSQYYNYDGVDGSSSNSSRNRSTAAFHGHHSRESSSVHIASVAASPPRTASLLPPARIVVGEPTLIEAPPLLRDPFNDPRPAPKVPDSAKEHRRGRSRSSSGTGLNDSLRNLNRWSASTASSRASGLANFSRRLSADILSGAFHSHRNRPSTSSSSPRSSPRSGRRSPSPANNTSSFPPPRSLPRISTGPDLAHEVLGSTIIGRTLSPTAEETPRQEQHRDDWDNNTRAWDQEPAYSQQHQGEQSITEAQQPSVEPAPEPGMAYTHNGHGHHGHHGHGRGGHEAGHSHIYSAATHHGSETMGSSSRERDRERSHRTPSQKTILSKALHKANTAVKLDNAYNFEGARKAYAEACALLQQVLIWATAEEDRRKLEAIHETYLNRVMELDQILVEMQETQPQEKELPRRPDSEDLDNVYNEHAASGHHDYANTYGPAGQRHYETDHYQHHYYHAQASSSRLQQSYNASSTSHGPETNHRETRAGSYLTSQYSLQSQFSKSRYNGLTSRTTMDNSYMPPPLSPGRPLSPLSRHSPKPPEHESPRRNAHAETSTSGHQHGQHLAPGHPADHHRTNSHESVSWLAPIDESDHSSESSVHSRSSSRIRRKHLRAPSGATEAEFDAALDDAIEAAYDDGYEPETDYPGPVYQNTSSVPPPTAPVDPVAAAMQKVEMARQMVRESEREALELANERERRLREQQQLDDREHKNQEAMGGSRTDDFYDDGNDSEEEERILEALTKGHSIEDFIINGQPQSSVPRESDSSGLSSRTWHSSMGSNPPTATTVLTPVSETGIPPQPTVPVPALPTQPPPQVPTQQQQSVRGRRLSGQNATQLKIETSKLSGPSAPPPGPATAGPTMSASHPSTGNYIAQQRQALSAGPSRTVGPFSSRPTPSPVPGVPENEVAQPEPLPPVAVNQQQQEQPQEQPRVGTPSIVRPSLRKNFSSSSLKSLRTRNHSISHLEESEQSPSTPLSTHFSTSRLPAVPSIPASIKSSVTNSSLASSNSSTSANNTNTAGLHLFDNHFHSPDRPGSPNPSIPDAPVPLEPCPTEALLRPFWLMRCLYQSLCHPRGGYLSNRLFIPRDVWRVKGVKLKAVEDKIANCDLLTAALQKLARVDTCDADAVLEEMQAFEGVLEQVQAALARKLGNEVGVNGTASLFREAAVLDAINGEGGAAGGVPRSASSAGKGGFSWRKLRNKGSSANLPASGYSSGRGTAGGAGGSSVNLAGQQSKDGKDAKEGVLMPSLPMTAHPTSRPPKRDVNSVSFAGPNANYMASLARLFDAAQTVDAIARQVDDPGLRHADKTQVGLELCTRHAADFFAFYICRFVLSDLMLLMDKFIKRGSEWVLM